jgi:hypothetical protein
MTAAAARKEEEKKIEPLKMTILSDLYIHSEVNMTCVHYIQTVAAYVGDAYAVSRLHTYIVACPSSSRLVHVENYRTDFPAMQIPPAAVGEKKRGNQGM